MVAVLEASPDVALVFCNSSVTDEHSQVVAPRASTCPPGRLEVGAMFPVYLKSFCYNIIGEPPVTLLRRTALEEVGMFDCSVPYTNDLELWVRINSARPCYYLDRDLVSIRFHEDRVTTGYRRRLGAILHNNYRLERAFQRNTRIPLFQRWISAGMFVTHHVVLCTVGWVLRRMLRIPEHRTIFSAYPQHQRNLARERGRP